MSALRVGDRVRLLDGREGYVGKLLDADGKPTRTARPIVSAVITVEVAQWGDELFATIPVTDLQGV